VIEVDGDRHIVAFIEASSPAPMTGRACSALPSPSSRLGQEQVPGMDESSFRLTGRVVLSLT
jgi:hypothetical protein